MSRNLHAATPEPEGTLMLPYVIVLLPIATGALHGACVLTAAVISLLAPHPDRRRDARKTLRLLLFRRR